VKVTGNTILITGGATGIGFALAQQFVQLGNEVIICGRRENRLAEAKQKIPGLHCKVCDLARAPDRKELYEWTVGNFPGLNMLINNGAYQNDYSLTDGLAALDGAEEEINVILTSPILLNALFTEHLRNIPDAAIVNVTSILGFMPSSRIPVYCAAKAGFHTYTLVLRKQFEKAGIAIKVFEAPPPRVDTELNMIGREKAGYANIPGGMSPPEYAGFVIDKIKSDELDIFYGKAGEDARFQPRAEVERSRL